MRRSTKRRRLGSTFGPASVALAVLVAGCSNQSGDAESTDAGTKTRLQTGTAETAGEWALVEIEPGPMRPFELDWSRPTLTIHDGEGWWGHDGCNTFGPVASGGMSHTAVGCEMQADYDHIFATVHGAVAVSTEGDRLIVESNSTRLEYLPRSLVPRTLAELAQAMLVDRATFVIDPNGPGLTFGLAGSDASCRLMWESGWPGPAAATAFAVFGPLHLPAMAVQEQIAVFDRTESSERRAAEADSVFAECREARPDDVWSDLDLDYTGPGRLAATSRATRTHNHDPYGKPSSTPMQRTTNLAVVSARTCCWTRTQTPGRVPPVLMSVSKSVER